MYDASTLVFEGTVIDIETPKDEYSLEPVNVMFHVPRVWKGKSENTITIYTEKHFIACGYPFRDKPGNTYLVYAYELEGQLNTNTCSRTRLRSHALENLFRLNVRNNLLGVSAIIASILLIGTILVLFLRRRHGQDSINRLL